MMLGNVPAVLTAIQALGARVDAWVAEGEQSLDSSSRSGNTNAAYPDRTATLAGSRQRGLGVDVISF
jgi:hypothetical protein